MPAFNLATMHPALPPPPAALRARPAWAGASDRLAAPRKRRLGSALAGFGGRPRGWAVFLWALIFGNY